MSAPSATPALHSLLATLVAGRAAVLQLAGAHLPFSRLVAIHEALSDEPGRMAMLGDVVERRLTVAAGRRRVAARHEPTDDPTTPAAAAILADGAKVTGAVPAVPSRIQRALGKAEISRSPVAAPARPVGAERRGSPARAAEAIVPETLGSEDASAPEPDTAPEQSAVPAPVADADTASEPGGVAASPDEAAAPGGVAPSPDEAAAPDAESVADTRSPAAAEDIVDETTPADASTISAESPADGLLVEAAEAMPDDVDDELDQDVADPPSLTKVAAHGIRSADERLATEPSPSPATVFRPHDEKPVAVVPMRPRPQIVVQAGPAEVPAGDLEPLDDAPPAPEPAFAAPRAVSAVVAGVRAAGPVLDDEAIGGDDAATDEHDEMASIGVSAPGGGIQLGPAAKKRAPSEPSAAPRLTDEDESPQTDMVQSPNIKMAGDDGRIAQLLDEAIIAAGRSDLAKAIQAYTDVVDLRHDRGDAYIGRGRAYLELGDYSSAMSDFQRAEDLQPDRPDSHVAMGDLYFARKEYRRAIEFYDQAVELDGSHAMARCRRGISHYYRKNYRQAFQDLQRAYSLDPEIPNIRKYVQMAVKKMERGD